MAEVVKVSSKSSPNMVAGALAGVIREAGVVEVQVIGAGALNQAIKAIAVASSYLSASGGDLCCRPAFAEIEIDGEARTAIRLVVEPSPVGRSAPVVDRSAPVVDPAPVVGPAVEAVPAAAVLAGGSSSTPAPVSAAAVASAAAGAAVPGVPTTPAIAGS